MIIQTGMRTDIPAFYAKWFANRLQEGFVYTRNPYYPSQVTKYVLDPSVVDLIGFCTKNPAPMFPYMHLLEPYGQYWFVTITPYGRDIEPNVPDKHLLLQQFIQLSNMVGVDRIGWRYDPIFISEKYSIAYHLRAFETMAKTLSGYTHTCVISFIDLYEKVKRNFPEVKEVSARDRLLLGSAIIEIAAKYDMVVRPCGEGNELEQFGADCSGCVTRRTYETALHRSIQIPKSAPLRDTCACQFGHDIGQYHTCGHLCRYCYANDNTMLVKENMKKHDPCSPFLIGTLEEGDVIRQAKQKRWTNDQISLFDE